MGNTSSHPEGTPPNAPNDQPAGSFPGLNAKDKDVPAVPTSPAPPSTPLLLPFAGHLGPQNPHALSHPQAHDYSKTIVTSLILDNQLAPFYRGLDDWEEDWLEADLRRTLDEVLEKDFAEEVQNSNNLHLREEREIVARGRNLPHKAEREERKRRESRAYLGAVECPICFLYYPPNINTSRCCQQPMCTECFVQIKRPEATSTHLESEPACCPFCMETDFGVIYERPTAAPTPSGVLSPIDRGSSPDPTCSAASALATSPDAATSAFSVFSASDEQVALPVKETVRRKSVSSKAKEVVTIDCIRPDWETKLNAVKAQAARRANRRIVMRQVGDRLVPIGYTSSRATGQADFSMSLPPDDGGNRRQRRTREREREMEEMMIMEAMRLSLVDHESHQRQLEEERNKGHKRSGSNTPTPSSSRRSSSARDTMGSWRASQQAESSAAGGGRAQAAASKLLSKINVNRSRANSKSSVHFAPSPTTLGPDAARNGYGSEGSSGGSRARSSSTPSPNPAHELHSSPLSTTVTTRRSLDVSHSTLGALDPSRAPPTVPESSEALASVTRDSPPDGSQNANTPLARDLAAAVEVDERPRPRSGDVPPPAPIPVPSPQFNHVEAPHLLDPVLDEPPVATGDDGYAPSAEDMPETPMSQNLIDFDSASVASASASAQAAHRPSTTSIDTGVSSISEAPSETSSIGYFDRPYAPLPED